MGRAYTARIDMCLCECTHLTNEYSEERVRLIFTKTILGVNNITSQYDIKPHGVKLLKFGMSDVFTILIRNKWDTILK